MQAVHLTRSILMPKPWFSDEQSFTHPLYAGRPLQAGSSPECGIPTLHVRFISGETLLRFTLLKMSSEPLGSSYCSGGMTPLSQNPQEATSDLQIAAFLD